MQCVALAGSDLLVCMIEYRGWFLGEGSFSEVSCGVRRRVSKGIYRLYYHYSRALGLPPVGVGMICRDFRREDVGLPMLCGT